MASNNRDEISRLELLHAAHPDGLVFPHLADAYRRAGRYAQAETLLRAGLLRHSDYSSAYVVLGRLHLDQGREEEAEGAFRRVLELDPDNQVALQHLGQLAVAQGRLDEGLERFRRLDRLTDSAEVEARVRDLERLVAASALGTADGDAPAPDEARPSVTTEASPPPAGGLPREVVTETMAELYERQGLREEAASVYRSLLDRTPGDPRLLAKLEAIAPARGASEATAPGIRERLSHMLGWRPEAADGTASATPTAADGAGTAATEPASAGTAEIASPAAPPADRSSAVAPVPAAPAAEGGDAAALLEITDRLVGLLEYRDPFFRGGSSLVRLLAGRVAEELGLRREERDAVALAALLRDLARLAVGGRLIASARRARTPEERRRIEGHVNVALHLLDDVPLPAGVRSAVRHHHERWDGAGYPNGLAGLDIPLSARILSVVDSFVAMISPRPYRLPVRPTEAAEELRGEAGRRYDPAVVDALLEVVARRAPARLESPARHQILLVNPFRAEAVATAVRLCSAGYLAEVAADLDRARERLLRVPVGALVLSAGEGVDWVVSLIRDLRADPSLRRLPIVVVNAETVKLRLRLLETGADVCFPSGISHAELQGTLGALVRRTVRVQGGMETVPDA